MTEPNPDIAEQAMASQLDNVVPSYGYQQLPVVGVGGSAGSLGSLRSFFTQIETPSKAAFVVVMHLSPDHESELAALIQAVTSLKVVKVEKVERIEPDTIYVIPPRKVLRSMDGHIALEDLPPSRPRHIAVDLFFRTLADTHGPHATAIVLSGIDGDGSIGIKRIKERGGLTIAQDPDEAEYDGMPRAAIATGMVDWILPVHEMFPRVRTYIQREQRVKLPPESPEGNQPPKESDEALLKDILSFLRARTGRNLAHYKRATVLRRIKRRMQVNDVDDLEGYFGVLRTHAGESGALLQDLLISVTNFFRDPDSFAALEAKVPQLFEGKTSSDVIRVWVVACATGEEAYSIAMLLHEYARTLDAPPALQVFASDLDEDAIQVARDGFYPTTIQADVSADRLKRFFIAESHGFRVRRELRETILFAAHDVLRDAPFSKIDLLSCRNLIIYLTRSAQTRLLDTFHFAMLPNALLFLGASESVDEANQRFHSVDRQHRVYLKSVMTPARIPALEDRSTLASAFTQEPLKTRLPVTHGPVFAQPSLVTRLPAFLEEQAGSLSELHFKLVEKLGPPSILVDTNYDLLHLSESAGQYLQYAGGKPTQSLLRLVHTALRVELRAALIQSARTGRIIHVPPIKLEQENDRAVSMRIAPAHDLAMGVIAVFFSEHEGESPANPSDGRVLSVDAAAKHLDRELDRMKSHLRETVEQYEAANEELKASNEELQAMNEELKSATEELETSREELQSINEELTTVNHELKIKVDQLSTANSDMHNLMDATQIATIFLDRSLSITRYTPSASALYKLIPGDVGRPLTDLSTSVDYPSIIQDARKVLRSLIPMETEIRNDAGQWFKARISPYRTLEDNIAGVVITFVDVTAWREGQDRLQASEARYSAIVSEAPIGVLQTDMQGEILFANKCYQRYVEYEEAELVGTSILDYAHPDERAKSVGLFAELASTENAAAVRHSEKRCRSKSGQYIWMSYSASTLFDGAGQPQSTLIVCNDITARKQAEDALKASEERLSMVLENANDYAIFSTDLDRHITSWNFGAEHLLGYKEEEILGVKFDVMYTEVDRAAGVPSLETDLALEGVSSFEERQHQRSDGSLFWASGATRMMRNKSGEAAGYVKILRDQTEERAARTELETSRSRLEQALIEKEEALAALKEADLGKDRFLAILSHELRNPLAAILSAGEKLTTDAQIERDVLKRTAQIIERQSRSMKVLLDDLLDMSRLRHGKIVLRKAPTTVNSVMDDAMEGALPGVTAAAHRAHINKLEQDRALHIDSVRLTQVLVNLLGNAVKYTPPGGTIRFSARCDGDEVVFDVEDNGIGMDCESVQSMFDMFRQAAAPGKTLDGMGIGLALARSIVELHGGKINGSSEGRGKGCLFTVSIPLTPPHSEASDLLKAPSDTHQTSPQRSVMKHARVLVVDDNEDAAWLLSELLTDNGHISEVANDGRRALDLLPTFKPEIVLLDLGLPEMDGYEVARHIRSSPLGKDIVLVATTGWGSDSDKAATAEAQFDIHLVKPISGNVLLDTIKHAQRRVDNRTG